MVESIEQITKERDDLRAACIAAQKSIDRFPGSVHDRARAKIDKALGRTPSTYVDPDEAELQRLRSLVAKLSDPPQIWRVVIWIPGLNIEQFIASDTVPTHEEITQVWQASGSEAELKPMGFRGPLRDSYPGVAQIERIKISALATGGARHG